MHSLTYFVCRFPLNPEYRITNKQLISEILRRIQAIVSQKLQPDFIVFLNINKYLAHEILLSDFAGDYYSSASSLTSISDSPYLVLSRYQVLTNDLFGPAGGKILVSDVKMSLNSYPICSKYDENNNVVYDHLTLAVTIDDQQLPKLQELLASHPNVFYLGLQAPILSEDESEQQQFTDQIFFSSIGWQFIDENKNLRQVDEAIGKLSIATNGLVGCSVYSFTAKN